MYQFTKTTNKLSLLVPFGRNNHKEKQLPTNKKLPRNKGENKVTT